MFYNVLVVQIKQHLGISSITSPANFCRCTVIF